ncbi:hypothetical protein, partial [Mesorhizobium sp.]|uniref:hypothetical protein n=1 Tax=Mesorhizobium sp. TaxID=1871066 RepID=UPI0025D4876B
VENGIRLALTPIFGSAYEWANYLDKNAVTTLEGKAKQIYRSDLLAFFHDRLKVYLRDQGAWHDLIDAVITPRSDDLL